MKFSRIDVGRVGITGHLDTTSSERSTSQTEENTTLRATVDQIAHPVSLYTLIVHGLGQEIQRGGDLEVHPKCNCRFHGSHPPPIHFSMLLQYRSIVVSTAILSSQQGSQNRGIRLLFIVSVIPIVVPDSFKSNARSYQGDSHFCHFRCPLCCFQV